MPVESYKKITIAVIVLVVIAVVIIAVNTSDYKKGTPSQSGPAPTVPSMNQNTQRPMALPDKLPDDPRELANLGDQFLESGTYDKAVFIYERVLEKDPQDMDTYNDMGLALHYMGRSSEAISILKKGTQVSPSYQRIWLSLGFILKSTGMIEEAKTALKKAAEINPQTDIGQEAVNILKTL